MPEVSALLTEAILEFLEAAVYTTLRSRNVYPQEAFHKRKLYGIVVSRARHPEISNYVGTALEQAKPFLQQGHLQEVDILFKDSQGTSVSKVSFLLQGLAASPSLEAVLSLEQALASCLLKLQFLDNVLKPLPPEASWDLLFVTTSRQPVQQLLVEEDPQLLLLGPKAPAAAPGSGPAAAAPGPSTGPAAASHTSSGSGGQGAAAEATPPAAAGAAGSGSGGASAGAAAAAAAAPATTAVPIHTVHIPGLLSMQVLAEELEEGC